MRKHGYPQPPSDISVRELMMHGVPFVNNIITRGWNVAPLMVYISRKCKGHNTHPINEKLVNSAQTPCHENQNVFQTN